MFSAGRILRQNRRLSSLPAGSLTGAPAAKPRRKEKRKFRCYLPFMWSALAMSFVGILIIVGGTVMCIAGWYLGHFDDEPEPEVVPAANATPAVVGVVSMEILPGRGLAYTGPVIMSFGCFAVVFACVIVCETRDRVLETMDERVRRGLPARPPGGIDADFYALVVEFRKRRLEKQRYRRKLLRRDDDDETRMDWPSPSPLQATMLGATLADNSETQAWFLKTGKPQATAFGSTTSLPENSSTPHIGMTLLRATTFGATSAYSSYTHSRSKMTMPKSSTFSASSPLEVDRMTTRSCLQGVIPLQETMLDTTSSLQEESCTPYNRLQGKVVPQATSYRSASPLEEDSSATYSRPPQQMMTLHTTKLELSSLPLQATPSTADVQSPSTVNDFVVDQGDELASPRPPLTRNLPKLRVEDSSAAVEADAVMQTRLSSNPSFCDHHRSRSVDVELRTLSSSPGRRQADRQAVQNLSPLWHPALLQSSQSISSTGSDVVRYSEPGVDGRDVATTENQLPPPPSPSQLPFPLLTPISTMAHAPTLPYVRVSAGSRFDGTQSAGGSLEGGIAEQEFVSRTPDLELACVNRSFTAEHHSADSVPAYCAHTQHSLNDRNCAVNWAVSKHDTVNATPCEILTVPYYPNNLQQCQLTVPTHGTL